MNDLAVRVRHLGKKFLLTGARPTTVREAIHGGFARPRASGFVERSNSGILWALKDVSLDIRRGEVVGLIGRNGAGKSVLLKILSGITRPSEGVAEIRGRIGALLELGTGFHPELSGRQNVHLNAALLGLRRVEIEEKVAEIVEFSGVEDAIDEPVKYYSSGMSMRLAFAVAVSLEPDVVLLDEIWAVGDSYFQRKALTRMEQLIAGGRTVVLVSHSMDTIANTCTRCILLDRGRMVMEGAPDLVIKEYLTSPIGISVPRPPAAPPDAADQRDIPRGVAHAEERVEELVGADAAHAVHAPLLDAAWWLFRNPACMPPNEVATVLLALPPLLVDPSPLLRSVRMVGHRFPASGALLMVARPQEAARYQALFPGQELAPSLIRETITSPIEAAVMMKGSAGECPIDLQPVNAERFYSVEPDGRLKLLKGAHIEHDEAAVARHIFSASAPPHSDGLFAFFPYGHLFRYPGMGRYNEFGHRITIDYHGLADRPPNHKVIAFFGGSACWSIYCYDDEVFTHRLQEILTGRGQCWGEPLRFSVLNFGLPGNVVLNEIMTYLLHCHRLRPDIVVGHDGFDDFFCGLTCDPYLLSQCDAAYHFTFEAWAKALLQNWCIENEQPVSLATRVPVSQPRFPLEARNNPNDVLAAYLRRKRQFCDLVTGTGAQFVWATEPYIYSKGELSRQEREYLRALRVDRTVASIYESIPALYERLRKESAPPPGVWVANADAHFLCSGASETLFADFRHLSPLGDQRLAEFYADVICNQVISTRRMG